MLAGRMGGDQVTVTGLKIELVDVDLNVIAVSGAVPGPRHSIIILKGTK